MILVKLSPGFTSNSRPQYWIVISWRICAGEKNQISIFKCEAFKHYCCSKNVNQVIYTIRVKSRVRLGKGQALHRSHFQLLLKASKTWRASIRLTQDQLLLSGLYSVSLARAGSTDLGSTQQAIFFKVCRASCVLRGGTSVLKHNLED